VLRYNRQVARPDLSDCDLGHTANLTQEGRGQAAAWARFYAIEVDSRPGELEYDRALAAAKRLDAEVALVVAASGGRPEGDWPF
jgi:hypothetical protein